MDDVLILIRFFGSRAIIPPVLIASEQVFWVHDERPDPTGINDL